jgi:hypothetical protein
MMKTAQNALVSHGKDSNLWTALNARLIEEAALIDDPRTTITLMMTAQFQATCVQVLSRLLTWAGIDPSCAAAL